MSGFSSALLPKLGVNSARFNAIFLPEFVAAAQVESLIIAGSL